MLIISSIFVVLPVQASAETKNLKQSVSGLKVLFSLNHKQERLRMLQLEKEWRAAWYSKEYIASIVREVEKELSNDCNNLVAYQALVASQATIECEMQCVYEKWRQCRMKQGYTQCS